MIQLRRLAGLLLGVSASVDPPAAAATAVLPDAHDAFGAYGDAHRSVGRTTSLPKVTEAVHADHGDGLEELSNDQDGLANDQLPPDHEAALARFHEVQAQLPGLLEQLLGCDAYSRNYRPPAPKLAGVYLLTEAGVHRYVGRTRNFNRRFGEHVAPKSTANKAAFAFNIAKFDAIAAGLAVVGTRDQIVALAGFDEHFTAAKQRVRAMEFRCVEINDPAVSTIFEVYVAIALHTEGEFNLFETH